MTTISYPTMNVKNFAINEIFLRGDAASVAQYCSENGLSLNSFTLEPKQRFSNDGAVPYQYYENEKWNLEFGFTKIVAEIVAN